MSVCVITIKTIGMHAPVVITSFNPLIEGLKTSNQNRCYTHFQWVFNCYIHTVLVNVTLCLEGTIYAYLVNSSVSKPHFVLAASLHSYPSCFQCEIVYIVHLIHFDYKYMHHWTFSVQESQIGYTVCHNYTMMMYVLAQTNGQKKTLSLFMKKWST